MPHPARGAAAGILAAAPVYRSFWGGPADAGTPDTTPEQDMPDRDRDDDGRDPARREELLLEERPRAKTPRLYRVLFHNDDYTTMEFVVDVLIRFFRKTATEAAQIMLQVHTHGVGVAGRYTREVAETKVAQVTEAAREEGFPLLLTMEPE